MEEDMMSDFIFDQKDRPKKTDYFQKIEEFIGEQRMKKTKKKQKSKGFRSGGLKVKLPRAPPII
jgi:hypothetical protein